MTKKIVVKNVGEDSFPEKITPQQSDIQKTLKIGYFGDGEWAHGAFRLFAEDSNVDISFVVVRNDTPDQTLIRIAEQHDIPWISHKNINSDKFLEWLSKHAFDLFVSMSFNQIFRKRTFELPEWGTINCHAGKLPFYRGRNILNWALINDEKEFGITVHYIDEGIDTGDIIEQITFPISNQDTYKTLLEKAVQECPSLLYASVKKIMTGCVEPIIQKKIHPVGTYYIQRTVGDENLNWHCTSREIYNFVRAISKPGPQARTWLKDKEICINKVEMVENAVAYKCIPGSVLFKDDEGVYVKTLDTMVKIVDYSTSGRLLRVGDRLISKQK